MEGYLSRKFEDKGRGRTTVEAASAIFSAKNVISLMRIAPAPPPDLDSILVAVLATVL